MYLCALLYFFCCCFCAFVAVAVSVGVGVVNCLPYKGQAARLTPVRLVLCVVCGMIRYWWSVWYLGGAVLVCSRGSGTV
jgi:hypothetical protein